MAGRKKPKNQAALFMPTPEAPDNILEPTPNDLDDVFVEEEEEPAIVDAKAKDEVKAASEPQAQSPVVQATEKSTLPSLNITDMEAHWKIIQFKRNQTVAALTHLLEHPITSDEQDQELAKQLVLARNSKSSIEEQRKNITTVMDAAKKEFMKPEKEVEELYEQGRKMRDKWLNEKLRKQEEERQRIAQQRNREQEMIRVAAALDTAVVDGLVACVGAMNEQIQLYVSTITKENLEQRSKKFDIPPKLNPEKYHAFFMVNWNPTFISQQEYNKLVADAKEKWTYEKCNDQYSKSGMGVLKMWKDDLPRIVKQKAEGQTEQVKQEAEMRVNAATTGLAEQKAEIQRTERNDMLNADFNAQVALQENVQDLKNVRKVRVAWIAEVEPQGIIGTLQDLVQMVMMHEKFNGIYAKDRQGVEKGLDEWGLPQYQPWIQELVDFAANHIDSLPGLEYKVINKTIQKSS
jgi:hypothetical protein